MASWTMTDEAAGVPKYSNTTLGVVGASSGLHANSTIGAFIANTSTGVFGVSTAELAYANNDASGATAHSGWVLRKEGQGGRAGRVQYEVLVAASSITGDADKDDALFDEDE